MNPIRETFNTGCLPLRYCLFTPELQCQPKGQRHISQGVRGKRSLVPGLPPIDSLDIWPLISGANATSPRAVLPLDGR